MVAKFEIVKSCGWIEEEVDKLMLKYGVRCLKNTEYPEKYQKVVKDVYGFDYEKHFRKMLIQLIGMYGTCRIEEKVGDTRRLQFKSVLGQLKTRRDNLAHTQLKGQTPNLLGFSVLKNNQGIVYHALCEYEQALKEYLK